MTLYKVKDVYPDYQERFFDGENIKDLDVYAGTTTDEKIGKVDDLLIDDEGYFRYLVVDTGFWIFGKKVLLPIGSCCLDEKAHRIHAVRLVSKEQVESLPEYDDNGIIDYDYEERVRAVYRTPSVSESVPVESSLPVESAGVRRVVVKGATPQPSPVRDRVAEPYDYDREPELYRTSEQDHRQLRLYEERLIADKKRVKTGEVAVDKRVETASTYAQVPVEKERVDIRVSAPASPVTPGEANFANTEVARIDVYEETADIHKETVVAEEIKVKKVVERNLAEATETVRHEELDIRTQGNPVVEESDRSTPS